MKVGPLAFLMAFGLLVQPAMSQTMIHDDVQSVLRAVADAMGSENVETVRITGAPNSTIRALGQAYSTRATGPNVDYPTLAMPSYMRVIDYNAMYSREDLTRAQGDNEPLGGGRQTIKEKQQVIVSRANHAWNMQGDTVVAQPTAGDQRLMDLYLTPHGFVKGALAASDVTAATVMMAIDDRTIQKIGGPAGRKVTYIAYSVGDYKIMGAVDDQNMVERTQTWLPDPLLGDVSWQWDHTGYEDQGDFMFPSRLHHHAGDIRNGPHHGININVASVEANVDVPLMAVPDAVRQAATAAVQVESEEIADGVWRIAGGSHHSIAVELEDSYVMIEAPLNEERSIAVIQEAQRVIPNKRLTHLAVTHHHFDHSSGLRTYVIHGAELVTHEASRDFYHELVLYPYPRLMQPDLLSTYYPRMAADKLPVFHTVGSEALVIGDDTRSVEFHSLQGLNHAEDMLIVYLPDEQILVNADLYSPPAGGGPGTSNASALSLRENIERLGLDVERHVGIHGAVGSHEDFLEATGN